MEFKINGNPWLIGYPIHEEYSLLEQKAFHLLSIIHASPLSNAHPDLSDMLVKRYEMSEISRILIEISVQIRNELDSRLFESEESKYNSDSEVGSLDINNGSKSKELNFREACNKIIHATHINFDLFNAESIRKYEQINSNVYLYGEHNNDSWKATLDIVKYISVLINIR